jgi:hypothetical protein
MNLHDTVNRWPMLYLHFVLFDANIVTAIIHMDTAILCSKPHCGLQTVCVFSHNGCLANQWVWCTSYPLWVLFNTNANSRSRHPFFTFILIFTGGTTGNAMQNKQYMCLYNVCIILMLVFCTVDNTESKGFWRWCVIINMSNVWTLSIV